MKTCRGYITSTPFAGERVPQHIQNIVIRDYSKKNKINLLMSNTEYCMKDCQLILNQTIKELDIVDGIIFYSLFQLPVKDTERYYIYESVISNKKILYFAVESIAAKSKDDFSLIEDIWNIKATLPSCYVPEASFNLGEK
jgi:sporadic carbohydrate cluster protein (TIGR04323 family)